MKTAIQKTLLLCTLVLFTGCSQTPQNNAPAAETTETTTEFAFEEQAAEAGNSMGNISNFGYAVWDGENVFYCDADGIYKETPDGGVKISENYASCLNSFGDSIIYVNGDDKNKIYAAKKDGSQDGLFCDQITTLLTADNDFIYFINGYDQNRIYKIDPSTKAVSQVSAGSCNGSVAVYGDYIYYNNVFDNGYIYRVAKDRSTDHAFIKQSGVCFNIYADKFYYIDEHDKNHIYCTDMEGNGLAKIVDEYADYLNIYDNKIYFSSAKTLYTTDMQGKNKKYIDDGCTSIDFANGAIYTFSKKHMKKTEIK